MLKENKHISTEHIPLYYRPVGLVEHTILTEICLVCSNIATGKLVPLSFCDEAKNNSKQITKITVWL